MQKDSPDEDVSDGGWTPGATHIEIVGVTPPDGRAAESLALPATHSVSPTKEIP